VWFKVLVIATPDHNVTKYDPVSALHPPTRIQILENHRGDRTNRTRTHATSSMPIGSHSDGSKLGISKELGLLS